MPSNTLRRLPGLALMVGARISLAADDLQVEGLCELAVAPARSRAAAARSRWRQPPGWRRSAGGRILGVAVAAAHRSGHSDAAHRHAVTQHRDNRHLDARRPRYGRIGKLIGRAVVPVVDGDGLTREDGEPSVVGLPCGQAGKRSGRHLAACRPAAAPRGSGCCRTGASHARRSGRTHRLRIEARRADRVEHVYGQLRKRLPTQWRQRLRSRLPADVRADLYARHMNLVPDRLAADPGVSLQDLPIGRQGYRHQRPRPPASRALSIKATPARLCEIA